MANLGGRPRELAQAVLSSGQEEAIVACLAEISSGPLIRKTSAKKGPSRDSSANPSNKYKVRAANYKRSQDLYNKNRKRLASSIIDGYDVSSQGASPQIQEIEEAYQRIFADPSPLDSSAPPTVDYETDNSYGPITLEELTSTLNSLKPSAAGPDGVTVQTLRKTDPNILLILFNSFLLTRSVPNVLKVSTTLIPKAGDLTNTAN